MSSKKALHAQVGIGACFGSLAARVADGSLAKSLTAWHPLKPSRSAQVPPPAWHAGLAAGRVTETGSGSPRS